MTEPIASLNGRFVPISQACLHVFDLGIVLGASVTEMARTFRHQCFRLDEHLERLFRSLKHVGFPIETTRDELARIATELVSHNAPLIPAGHDLGVSMFITAGSSLTYLGAAGRAESKRPAVCLHTFSLPFELWVDKLEQGQHVITPSIRHLPPECLDPKIKSRSRMHWYLADEQARQSDPQAIALLVDRQDCISETSTANFFIVQEGAIVTPTGRNTLHGISQMVVRELAAELNLRFEIRDFQTYDVVNAEEAFTSSTPYCILPVTRINHRPIGAGTPGPVFHQLLEAWSRKVNVDLRAQMRQGAADRRLA